MSDGHGGRVLDADHLTQPRLLVGVGIDIQGNHGTIDFLLDVGVGNDFPVVWDRWRLREAVFIHIVGIVG